MEQNIWRKCSSCKQPIPFGSRYYVCSVSTCNNLRTGYVFCGIPCFERHLPGARHKDAGAVEKNAPGQRMFATTQASAPNPAASVKAGTGLHEVLIIASRLKEYIQARSEFNTSQSVMDVLSDHVRVCCDRAIENARAEGRRTVMDRDFSFLQRD